MQIYSDEKQDIRALKSRTKEAIEHAAKGNWKAAEETNRIILTDFPTKIDALNRLGKALSELGRYSEACDIFKQTISNDPPNPIARKNLQWLEQLNDVSPKQSHQAATNLLTSDWKKTYTTTIMNAPKDHNCLEFSNGEVVTFSKFGDTNITAKTTKGVTIGELEPRMALRLSRLMAVGNQYTGEIISTSEIKTKIFIQEIYYTAKIK
jgi:tetratricopeptide (TPR) repeat protein